MLPRLVGIIISLLVLLQYNAAESLCDSSRNGDVRNSFLWELRRDPPSYFFGTIHVPYTHVWDYIADNAKDAFKSANNIYFELDMTDHKTAADLADCQLLPSGATVDSVLPSDLYKKIKRHMDYIKRKVPIWLKQSSSGYLKDYQFQIMAGSWRRMKPIWLMLMLNSLTKSDIQSFGIPVLDLYLAREASRWGKRTGAVENVSEQCDPLNGLNITQVMFALNQTVYQHSEKRKSSQSRSESSLMTEHYKCGNISSLLFRQDTIKVPRLAGEETDRSSRMVKEIEDYFQQEMLHRRNEIMAQRVTLLLQQHPNQSFFFAFGAGHFIGENSVIDRVRREGFNIAHLSAQEKLLISSPESPSLNEDSSAATKEFSPMDSTINSYSSDVYLQTLAQLSSSAGSRNVRHERGKNQRRENKKLKPANYPNFTKLWVRIDDISVSDYEDVEDIDYEDSQSVEVSSSISDLSSSAQQLKNHYFILLTILSIVTIRVS